jgi:hypothetical protein
MGASSNARGQAGVAETAPPTAVTQAQSSHFIYPNSCRTILPLELALEPEDFTNLGTAVGAAEAKIAAALASPTTIEAKETPLTEVVKSLKALHKIEIQLDVAALKEAGLEPDVHVTAQLSGISLRSALHLILDNLQLKYVIHNEVLLITSPTKAESLEFYTTKLYPVKDLVLVRNQQGAIEVDFQPLQDLIIQSVSTLTWQDNGGPGTVVPFQSRGRSLLVVSAMQEIHEQIADLLAALRTAGVPKEKISGEKTNNGKPANYLLLPIRPDPQPVVSAGIGGSTGQTSGGTAGMGSMGGGGGFY